MRKAVMFNLQRWKAFSFLMAAVIGLNAALAVAERTSVGWAKGMAQQGSTDGQDAFELVSIRPTNPVRAGGGRGGVAGAPPVCGGTPQIDPGRFAMGSVSVYNLITIAYGMGQCRLVSNAGRIVGGPEWIMSDQFAVEATIPQGSVTYTVQQLRNGNAPQLQSMIKMLLAQRFKLAVHQETRDLPVYALTVSRGGPKLTASQEGGCRYNDGTTPPVPGTRTCGTRVLGSIGPNLTIDITRMGVGELAAALSLELDRQVIDSTRLSGLYDIHLEFARDAAAPGSLPPGAVLVSGGPVLSNRVTGPVDAAPSIFSAIQEQLGLRLEAGKGPAQLLVIDSVSKPSEN